MPLYFKKDIEMYLHHLCLSKVIPEALLQSVHSLQVNVQRHNPMGTAVVVAAGPRLCSETERYSKRNR